MKIDEPMDTDGEFYGQPESTVRSDLDESMSVADLDSVQAAELKQPATKFDMERGWRKEPGHPAFPWHRIVEQREDGLITVRLERWKECEELPEINMKKVPFAFPWDVAQIKKGLEDPAKLAEWNDIIAQSMTLPMFVYTPTLFAALMATPEGRKPEERNWMPPCILASSVFRAYNQITFFLSNNKSLLNRERREDALVTGGKMLQTRMDKLVGVLMQNPKFRMLASLSLEESLHEQYDAIYQSLAETMAGHTIAYLKAMETTLLRLCDMDPYVDIGVRKLLADGAIPDPASERIKPFSEQFLEEWRRHNTLYPNRLYQLRNQAPPIGDLHPANVRGISKEAMWQLLRLLVAEQPK